MPTRNVVLTDHQDRFIDEMVGCGRYQNASEVLREGLRMVERREAEDAARLEALRRATDLGLDALARGDYREFESPSALVAYLNETAAKVLDDGDVQP